MKNVKQMSVVQFLLLLFGIILICCFMPNMGKIMEGMCSATGRYTSTTYASTCAQSSYQTSSSTCPTPCTWS